MPVADRAYVDVHAEVPFAKTRPTQPTACHRSDAASVPAELRAAFAMHENGRAPTNEAAARSDEPAAQHVYAPHGRAGE